MTSFEITHAFNLDRFLEQQKFHFNQALFEIKIGKKQSHWMWYIFPQFIGLGSSSNSTHYAIKSKEEAQAYLNHSILGQRLVEITSELLKLENLSAYSIFGSPDDVKLKSSMTLFNAVQHETKVFEWVLDKYFFSTNAKRH